MEFLDSGDLRYYLNKQYHFNEDQTSKYFVNCRIHHSLHYGRIKLPAFKKCHPQRSETWKYYLWQEGILQGYRSWNCQILEVVECSLDQWDSWVHVAWSTHEEKSFIWRWLLCCWSYCIWVVCGKKTVFGKRSKGDQVTDASKISKDSTKLQEYFKRGHRLHKQGNFIS